MNRTLLAMASAALTALACSACGGPHDPGAGKSPTATFGPGGGTLTILGGPLDRTTLSVPAGAVTSSSLTITIQLGSDVRTGAFALVGPPVKLDPPGATFGAPVTVRIPFVRSAIPAGRQASEIVILRRDDATGAIATVPATGLDPFTLLVTFTTTTFATFQAAVPRNEPPIVTATESPAGGAPPLVPTSGGPVTLRGSGLFAGATVVFGPAGVQGSTTVQGSAVVEGPNGTSLEVLAPPSPPGVVPVTVTNLDGRSFTFPQAFRYESGPVFLDTVGPLSVAPFATAQTTARAIDPAGLPVSYAIAPAPNLTVDGAGTVRFAPTLFQVGAFTATVTASSANGSTSRSFTVMVPRPSTPTVLVRAGDQPPGAPAPLADLPPVDSASALGALNVPVAFVGTSVVGILHRDEAAVAVVASSDGAAFAGSLAFVAPFVVGTTGADGLAGFVAAVTSDGGGASAAALCSIAPNGSATLLLIAGQSPAPLTSATTAPVGTFASFGRPCSDGAGGLWFAATVTSGTTLNALYRWQGSPRLLALEGDALGPRTIQSTALEVLGASAGSALVRVVTDAGPSLYRFSANGATLVLEPGQVLDAGGTTRAVASIDSARAARRSREEAVRLTYATGESAVHAVIAPVTPAPVMSAKVVAEALDSIGGLPVLALDLRAGIEEVTTAVAAVASTTAGEHLVRGAGPQVVAGPATVVPAVGGTFASFDRLDSGGTATAWVSPIAGGTRPSGLFATFAGGAPQALLLEGDPLTAGGAAGRLLGSPPFVHPETTLVIVAVPVQGGSASSVLLAR